jgi:hypothetical protein
MQAMHNSTVLLKSFAIVYTQLTVHGDYLFEKGIHLIVGVKWVG